MTRYLGPQSVRHEPGASLLRRIIGLPGLHKAEQVRIGWGLVLWTALAVGAYDVIAAGLVFGSKTGPLPSEDFVKGQLPFLLLVAPLLLWSNLKFNKLTLDLETIRAEPSTILAPAPSEARGFWRSVRWWFLFIIGGLAVVALLMFLAVLTAEFG